MNKIDILDVTLRDGGYCNNWQFGAENIIGIISGLLDAGVSYIECGYLSHTKKGIKGRTVFDAIDSMNHFIPTGKKKKCKYLAMVNYGEIDVDKVPLYSGYGISGVRVAFRKKEWREAIDVCQQIKKKGYDIFVQPMNTLSYSEEEFKEMIQVAKTIMPYAVYIVDSFGMMTTMDIANYYKIVEEELPEEVVLGFHGHNNMQMATTNAQSFCEMKSRHGKLVDASIMGMGRGAGNLNTEIFCTYINKTQSQKIDIQPILYIIDEIINTFYIMKPWGYSLPNYLSAKYNEHPKYAIYLCDKNTLKVDDINNLLEAIPEEYKDEFHLDYIENAYVDYMDKNETMIRNHEEFKKSIYGKEILLIAPGPTSIQYGNRIIAKASEVDVVIAINHIYDLCKTDYVFFSNKKRYLDVIDKVGNQKTVVTSNIIGNEDAIRVSYKQLLNDMRFVEDNAGLMTVKMLIEFGASKLYLAGFDGFSHDIRTNYADENMVLGIPPYVADAINYGMKEVLEKYQEKIEIDFVTPTNLQ